MTTIVCQGCNTVIDYQESDKHGVLYGRCDSECTCDEQFDND